MMSRLTYNSREFLLDNRPITIISGAIHYFRVVPELWKDRLLKLKECGFNTVETYIPWNLHEHKKGKYSFDGILDLKKFTDTAKQLGLYVILRPGPYICAELDMGGLPSWLLNIAGLKIRCFNASFLERVRMWYSVLFETIRPCFIENGGNVIALQLENEYGSFGDDEEYMAEIEKIYRENDIPCLLFTADGPGYFMLSGGTRENILSCVNFGSNPDDNFELLKKFKPNQPGMCMEYWNGWFDHWYEEHHTRDVSDTAETFRQMLDGGHSVNFYMFHGGTNFGFTNGANFDKYYMPTVTSYDYNAPLSECGDLTDKYFAVHDVMEKFLGVKLPVTSVNSEKMAYGSIVFTEKALLFENTDNCRQLLSRTPLTFEEAGQAFGYMLYESTLKGPFEKLELEVDGLNDRAYIYINGELSGIKENTGKRDNKVYIKADFGEEINIKLLVENMGRVNYGEHITDNKGITKGVRIANRYHFGWMNTSLPMDTVNGLKFNKNADGGTLPAFYRGILDITKVCDTFIELSGFTKGQVYINGFNIGRFFNPAGPQKTLYVPAPLLKTGANEIIVFEAEECREPIANFTDRERL